MVDKIEMSLDDIIKASKSMNIGKGGRGGNQRRRGSGRPGNGVPRVQRNPVGGIAKGRTRGGGIRKVKYARGDVNSAWKHDMYDGPKRLAGGIKLGTGVKLLVSNLDYGVSESDIHELFADFGPLKSASVHYDRSGRSLGTADVVFERKADAVKAMKQYHGVPLDGRPMNIQLATSEVPSPKARMSNPNTRSRPPMRRTTGRGGAPARRGRNVKTQAPTVEELDAELDAYVNDMK